MSELRGFLLARIGEDEAVARAAAKRPIVSRGQWGGEPRAQPRVDSIGMWARWGQQHPIPWPTMTRDDVRDVLQRVPLDVRASREEHVT
jgi:hypothetical protein